MNERLRRALTEAGLDIDDLARATGASHDTAQRWIKPGRTPQRRYRIPITQLLECSEADLWPETALPSAGTSTNEIVTVYSRRATIPVDLWQRMLKRSKEQIDLLGADLLDLFEGPGFVDLLWSTPGHVRIVLADPYSPVVAERDEELGLRGTLRVRILTALDHVKTRNVKRLDGYSVELRLHSAPMYSSIFRVDDEMLVTPHIYGQWRDTPVLHLRRRETDGIFESYLLHFENVFIKAVTAVEAVRRAQEERGTKVEADE